MQSQVRHEFSLIMLMNVIDHVFYIFIDYSIKKYSNVNECES